VRLIDAKGKNLGIFRLEEALQKARENGLDLILITQNTTPPVCKITDYGKYIYQKQKKERKKENKERSDELKNIRVGFNISDHDMQIRVKMAKNFLKKGYKVRIEMKLRGREKRLIDFAKEKIKKFLEALQNSTPIKIEKELKRAPRGLTIIVAKST